MQISKILISFLAASAISACAQSIQVKPQGDAVLLEMNAAYKAGNNQKLSQLLPQTKGHALEVWAAYWELKARLETASAAEVDQFLTQYAGTYQEDRLRNDWLLWLGQRQDWAEFARHYAQFRMADDREVLCYALLRTYLQAPKDQVSIVASQVAPQIREAWYAQRSEDKGCNFAVQQLVVAQRLAPRDVWLKARTAMELRRPQLAIGIVKIVDSEGGAKVQKIYGDPVKFLNPKKTQSNVPPIANEWVVLALIRWAAKDPEAAAQALQTKWHKQLSAEERNWLWAAIGKQAAQGLMPSALMYFKKIPQNAALPDDFLIWRARSALRQGAWSEVLASIGAMTTSARQESSWIYWEAQALLHKKSATQTDLKRAHTLLQNMAGIDGFYEQLALSVVGKNIQLPASPLPLTELEKNSAKRNSGLNRGLYAILIGLRSEGVREWNYATNMHVRGGMSERELLAAAQFACDNQIWDRCINTSERARQSFDTKQRFPLPFKDEVVKRSLEIGLDPAYVYGLIRQESRFITDARSGVGASGLMQIMPATARWTAKKIGLTDFTASQINDHATNIKIGTAYLKLALDEFEGSLPLAAAAYNAGPGRSRSWRNGPVLDAAIWIENIPFNETRDYVKKVLSNMALYAAVLSGQAQSLPSRLGTIGPRDESKPDVNKDLP